LADKYHDRAATEGPAPGGNRAGRRNQRATVGHRWSGEQRPDRPPRRPPGPRRRRTVRV